jgi:hypothetical protein
MARAASCTTPLGRARRGSRRLAEKISDSKKNDWLVWRTAGAASGLFWLIG